MEKPTKVVVLVVILCGVILANAQRVHGQDVRDLTPAVAAADTPLVALAQIQKRQGDKEPRPQINLNAVTVAGPQNKVELKIRNYTKVGNALGFMLPVLTMVGFVLVNMQ